MSSEHKRSKKIVCRGNSDPGKQTSQSHFLLPNPKYVMHLRAAEIS